MIGYFYIYLSFFIISVTWLIFATFSYQLLNTIVTERNVRNCCTSLDIEHVHHASDQAKVGTRFIDNLKTECLIDLGNNSLSYLSMLPVLHHHRDVEQGSKNVKPRHR